MAILQNEKWVCPFCGIGEIEVLVKPSAMSTKRTACRAGRGNSFYRSAEESEIISDKCPNCGKSKKDIIRAYRDGVPEDKEKLKQRFLEVMRLREELNNK